MPEYLLMMKAYSYRMVDEQRDRHELAFEAFRVQGQKKAGKGKSRPVYKTFKAFFDYEKHLKELEKKHEDALNPEEEPAMPKPSGRLMDLIKREKDEREILRGKEGE